VKCIALLRNIIKGVEGLHNDCGRLNANDGTQLKKSSIHNDFSTCSKQIRDLYCKYFNIPAGSVPWQQEAIGDVQ
jgi:hypothetical protein